MVRHNVHSLSRLGLCLSLVLLACVLLLPLTAMVVYFPPWSAEAGVFDAYLWQVVRFTLWQALLSTILSILLALLAARALARRPAFVGRRLLLTLFGLPVVLPSIVAVFAIVTVFGYQGWMNKGLALLGLARWEGLYGLDGILLGHVFFNLPLAIRLLLPLWERIPIEHWRLSAQLDLSGGGCFRLIEWPVLRSALPGIAGLIFLLCATSFAVIFALGGGPQATTLPVAIYESVHFDVDLAQAAMLSLLQLILCVLLLLLLPYTDTASPDEPARWGAFVRRDAANWSAIILDTSVLIFVALFVALPVLALFVEGVSASWNTMLRQPVLWEAVVTSLSVAWGSALFAAVIGLPLSMALAQRHRRTDRWLRLSGQLGLALPPVVLGTGWFLLLHGQIGRAGPLLIVIVNGMMAVPYVLRLMVPSWRSIERQYGALSAQLGLRGWAYWRAVLWPLSRSAMAPALALSMCLGLGDLGVVALFGNQTLMTLPMLLYEQLSSYQTQDAAVTALIMTLLVALLFWGIDRTLGTSRFRKEP